jgi:hypothetical protein
MLGAGIAPRGRAWTAALATSLLVACAGAPLADANVSRNVTIDFSTHGEGPLRQDFYKRSGIVFNTGSFVGYVFGDQALVGPVGGTFKSPVSSLSVRAMPAIQGTARYTLTAFGSSSKVVGRSSMTVTQDEGDPLTSPFGYFTIDLRLPRKAKSFTITNSFLRSSFPHVKGIEFAVSSIAFSRS